MGYVDNNLMNSEVIRYRTRLHWINLILPVALSLVLIGIPWLLYVLIARATSEFAVTNRRVIVAVGWLSRRTLELNLAKLETVGVDQPILGRILGYGAIVITGSGATKEVFEGISDPVGFRKAVNEAVDAAMTRGAAASA